MPNTAIIVAAGSGQRFGPAQPKAFVPIHGKPLIIHTLERFQACPLIHEIVLVLSESGMGEFAALNFKSEISNLRSVITGGKTRAESVKNGFDVIDAKTAGIIAVHDGARPIVTVDEITRTIEEAEKAGAACLVADVTDTIKSISGNEITRTLDRAKLRRALTPQAFRYEVLRRAFEGADLTEDVTDECYLVEKLGYPISIVEGSPLNIKITRPEDLRFAEAILSEPPA